MKIKNFLFHQISYHSNTLAEFEEASREAGAIKAKFIAFYPGGRWDLEKTMDNIIEKCYDTAKANAFVFSPDFRLVILNLKYVKKYGPFHTDSFVVFLDWLKEKAKSEGHTWAEIPDGLLVTPEEAKKPEKKKTSKAKNKFRKFEKAEGEEQDVPVDQQKGFGEPEIKTESDFSEDSEDTSPDK